MEKCDTGISPFVWDRSGARVIRVFGDEMRIHITAEQTGGRFSIIEQSCRLGEWSWAHRHRNEHHFVQVVKGKMEFEISNERKIVQTEQYVFIPQMSWHRFRAVGSTGSSMLFFNIPGGLEVMFVELANLEEKGDVSAEEQDRLARKYGVDVAS